MSHTGNVLQASCGWAEEYPQLSQSRRCYYPCLCASKYFMTEGIVNPFLEKFDLYLVEIKTQIDHRFSHVS